ncbi:hypothetical protein [Desulfonema magnum]|uniref:Uncharacterized protein n=1 Tax=Desulfonema magnum TaxID=45655 RepID=A0A975BVR8_9BACT|nr:hypothetical protein [Desulfonema magnum]QTA92272.1 Uncharacterized protein dnm_083480 [Desulfonema magnum]
MKFWQHIRYWDLGHDQLKNEIDQDKKDKDLKHKILEQDQEKQGQKKEKLYQRIFFAVLFMGGLTTLKDYPEIGFFAIGSGLYGLTPENGRKDQPKNTPLKNQWILTSLGAFILMIVIITLQFTVFSVAKEKIGQLLWAILGIITMCFISAFKRFINSQT